MKKNYWYLSDLAKFCAKQKLYQFEATGDSKPIIVSIPAQYAANTLTNDDERFLAIHLKACHTLTNRNHSEVLDDVMQANKDTILNCPILADVRQLEDEDGNEYYDFTGHTMSPMVDPITGEERMNYIERAVGTIPATSAVRLELDQKSGRNYLHVDGLIYTEHGNLAASIMRNRKEVSCSVEMAVSKMHYDISRKVLVIEAFKFIGVTLLGKHVQPGMEGAQAYTSFEEIIDAQNQNYSSDDDIDMQLQHIADQLHALQSLISEYKISEKGGHKEVNLFEKLLEKYGKTADEIAFETAGLSGEELEAAFAAAFDADEDTDGDSDAGDTGTEADPSDSETDPADPTDPAEPETGEDTEDPQPEEDDGNDPANEPTADPVASGDDEQDKPRRYEYIAELGVIRSQFEISVNDLMHSLYELLESVEDRWCYIADVYLDSNEVVYGVGNEYFKRSFTLTDGMALSLGEAISVKPRFLTDDEWSRIDEMRATHSSILADLTAYQQAEEKTQKQELMQSKDYEKITSLPQFAEIDIEKFTLNELSEHLDALLLNAVKTNAINFAAVDHDDTPAVTKRRFAMFAGTTDPEPTGFLAGLSKLVESKNNR